jgi:hypothetical protein
MRREARECGGGCTPSQNQKLVIGE